MFLLHLTKPQRRMQSGVTLIEVLVSILILSLGVLAMLAMQAYVVAAQKSAVNRALASALANEAAELIRLNQFPDTNGLTALANGFYDVSQLTNSSPPAGFTPCIYPACNTPKALAIDDLNRLRLHIRRDLPKGGLEISRQTGSNGFLSRTDANLWIVWEESAVLDTTRQGQSTSSESNSDNCPASVANLKTLPRCFYLKVTL
jgi:type IV pilus assembly protein PilV